MLPEVREADSRLVVEMVRSSDWGGCADVAEERVGRLPPACAA